MRTPPRRSVLRAVGAVASTTAVVGCAGALFGRDLPSFASRIVTDDWLQAANVTPDWKLQHARYVDLAALAEHVERFPTLREWVASAPLLDPAIVRDLVVTIREYQYTVARLRDGGAALRAADDVWETFEPMDADGYWSRVRGDHVLQVVGDGVLLSMDATPDEDASVVERRGRLERRAVRLLSERPSTFATESERAERMARVVELADDPTVARLSTQSAYVPEAIGSAEAFAVGERTTDLRAVALYPSSPDPDAFLETCRDRTAFQTYEDLESERRGDAALVTGSTPTKRLDFLAYGWPAPDASFAFEYDAATRALTVVHDGGESFPAARVRLVAEGGGEQTVLDSQFADDHGTVTAGDAVTATVPVDATVVEVRWQFNETLSKPTNWEVLDSYVP
ncbi:hypothetical protein [Halorubellus sp. PRR65]|uniref:hypothetical protein n=1 Tax=Halorubellus sp. PRR65 TaxID=3098148 RepID=UPI002B25E607|nr:hypothetical protein [Halorubellus sp. PRR65]